MRPVTAFDSFIILDTNLLKRQPKGYFFVFACGRQHRRSVINQEIKTIGVGFDLKAIKYHLYQSPALKQVLPYYVELGRQSTKYK